MVSPALEGIFRSLRMYRRDSSRHTTMDKLYGNFLKPGDLAFDIGAHVGDRIASFRRSGARVIALEPQPLAHRALRLLHGRDRHVELRAAACGAETGTMRLLINSTNPTVTTASESFTRAAHNAGGWEGQVWDTSIDVPCVTLDSLIAQYGVPHFTKIDVEGFEADVLAGLSQPLPALSFEFTTIQRAVAAACLERLEQLGSYAFNFALGESQRLEYDEPCSFNEMRTVLQDLPHTANSGDIYALRLESRAL